MLHIICRIGEGEEDEDEDEKGKGQISDDFMTAEEYKAALKLMMPRFESQARQELKDASDDEIWFLAKSKFDKYLYHYKTAYDLANETATDEDIRSVAETVYQFDQNGGDPEEVGRSIYQFLRPEAVHAFFGDDARAGMDDEHKENDIPIYDEAVYGNVFLKESTAAPGSGMGLYANTDIPPNHLVTQFQGTWRRVKKDSAAVGPMDITATYDNFTKTKDGPKKYEEVLEGWNWPKMKELFQKGGKLDPIYNQFVAQLANDARDDRNNAEFFEYVPAIEGQNYFEGTDAHTDNNLMDFVSYGYSKPRGYKRIQIYLVSTKPIKKDEEIFVDYGPNYDWSHA